jgi:pSer/pThr/pTyr-binding forkhead associated (FHA) protein
MQEHGDSTTEFRLARTAPRPRWHERVRALLPGEGRYLAYLGDDDEIEIFPLATGWTRIGRSVAADIRLDDPTVSRRHALVVSDDEEPLRVLDDRSLNGVFLNNELVEWGRLEDGDELAIGRFRLLVLEV